MQKIFIIFAVITLSLTISAQMHVRNFENITNDPAYSKQNEIKNDSIKSPNFVELNRLGVQKALTENNYTEASIYFSKAVEAAPDCFRCKMNLGRSFIATGKADEAIRLFNELAASNVDNFEVYASLGEAYNQKALYAESQSYFQKSLKLNAKDPIVLTNYAVTLSMLEKHQEALENLNKAVKLKPDFAEAYSNRGYTLFILGRQKDALESLKKAEQINPNLAEVHNNLGVVLDFFGKKKEAKTHFEKAVQLKSDYGEAICNLAIKHLEEGNRDAAYQQLKQLEKVDFKMAGQLRDVIWSKYVVDASKVKEKH